MTKSSHRNVIHDAALPKIVGAAQAAVEDGDHQALDFLDRRLRRALLRWIRGHDIQVDELTHAIRDALNVARAHDRAWIPRWKYLLKIVRHARETAVFDQQPQIWGHFTATQQDLMRMLYTHGSLTNTELQKRLGKSASHISNLTSKLSQERLLTRLKVGRNSHAALTVIGLRLLGAQGEPAIAPGKKPPTGRFWDKFNPNAVDMPV